MGKCKEDIRSIMEGKTIEAVYVTIEGGVRIIFSDDTTIDIDCWDNGITMKEVYI